MPRSSRNRALTYAFAGTALLAMAVITVHVQVMLSAGSQKAMSSEFLEPVPESGGTWTAGLVVKVAADPGDIIRVPGATICCPDGPIEVAVVEGGEGEGFVRTGEADHTHFKKWAGRPFEFLVGPLPRDIDSTSLEKPDYRGGRFLDVVWRVTSDSAAASEIGSLRAMEASIAAGPDRSYQSVSTVDSRLLALDPWFTALEWAVLAGALVLGILLLVLRKRDRPTAEVNGSLPALARLAASARGYVIDLRSVLWLAGAFLVVAFVPLFTGLAFAGESIYQSHNWEFSDGDWDDVRLWMFAFAYGCLVASWAMVARRVGREAKRLKGLDAHGVLEGVDGREG